MKSIFSDNISGYNLNKSNIINNVNQNLLGAVIYKFINEKEDMLNTYISNLSSSDNTKLKADKLLKDIFTLVKPLFIKDLILYQLLTVLTFKDTDEEKKLSLLSATI